MIRSYLKPLPMVVLAVSSGLLSGCVDQALKTLTQQSPSKPLAEAEPQYPTAPILRVETGMHTAAITQVSVDRAGEKLLTVSVDKTARLWSLSDGALIRTFRVPLSAGENGELYAGVISAKGDWVVLGGFLNLHPGSSGTVLYIMDTETGEVIRRIEGFNNNIGELCLSKNNQFLAVGMIGQHGVKVYSTDNWTEVFSDSRYLARITGCDFSARGELVISSRDGSIRLYGKDFGLKKTIQFEKGLSAGSVRFSPDGRSISAAIYGKQAVSVLSASDLSERYKTQPLADSGRGSLNFTSWLNAGEILYAGGSYYEDGDNLLLAFSEQGKGDYKSIPVSKNTIMSLIETDADQLVIGTFDPLWTLYDHNLKKISSARSATIDYREISFKKGFLADNRAEKIYIKSIGNNQKPLYLNISDLQIQEATELPGSGFSSPAIKSNAISVSNWQHNEAPKLNNKPLKLRPYEISRSLAIAPDQQSFLLGTEWYLRRYSHTGELEWSIGAPGTAWRVNISGDGKTAVAALGDGTIRWYRYRDGKELLALFVHQESREWVAWTPSGYYAASANGDELIGWHLNNGADQAPDFYPASTLRERYYRPDVVKRVLLAGDEAKALRLADLVRGKATIAQQPDAGSLPPVVDLISPVEGDSFSQRQVTLRYRIRNADTVPLDSLKVQIDGRPLSDTRGLQRLKSELQAIKNGAEHELTLQLPERDLTLTLIAENRFGTSPAASVSLKWQGVQHQFKPRLYVLAAGIADYQDASLNTLDYPDDDARAFIDVVRKQGQGIYRDIEVKPLINTSSGALLDGLDWLRDEVTENDVAMVFLAGHGVNDRDGDYFFLTRDADTDRLRRTAVEYYDIRKTLSALPGKTLAFIDTCHAGNIMGNRKGGADLTGIIQDLTAAENGIVVFASSTGRQFSLEDPRWGHGAFTHALLSGIGGKADYDRNGAINTDELSLYLSREVKRLTGNAQTPTTVKPTAIQDIPIFSVVPD